MGLPQYDRRKDIFLGELEKRTRHHVAWPGP